MSAVPRKHVACLDGLRGLAILGVWAVHAGIPGSTFGWLGVELFFALSGFLITTLLVKEQEETGQVNLLKFWGRRFLRLIPAYYLYIGFITLLIFWGGYTLSSSGGWSPYGYLASLWFYFNNFLPRGGFWELDSLSIHIWSLALEEQFYLVWPILFVFAIRLKRSFLVPLALVSALLVCRPFVSEFGILSLPEGRGFAIVMGCAMALWIRDRKIRGDLPDWLLSARTRLNVIVAISICILVLTVIHSLNLYGNPDLEDIAIKRWLIPPFALLFSLLIAMFWYGSDDWIANLLSWHPLVYIGKISYGIYLYHMVAHYLTWDVLLAQIEDWPSYPKMALRLVVYGILSVGIAALSYHFYEKPFLRLKQSLR